MLRNLATTMMKKDRYGPQSYTSLLNSNPGVKISVYFA
jgi:hypothetical protein